MVYVDHTTAIPNVSVWSSKQFVLVAGEHLIVDFTSLPVTGVQTVIATAQVNDEPWKAKELLTV